MPLLKVNQIASYTGNTLTIGTSTDTVEFTGGVVKANTIQNANSTNLIVQTNTTTMTVGTSGQTIIIPSGVTFNASSASVNLPVVNLTTGVTGTLPVANGGTGQSSLTTNNVILGNGTLGVQFVSAGTTGNVLTANGSSWASSAAPSAFSSSSNSTNGYVVFSNGLILQWCQITTTSASLNTNYSFPMTFPNNCFNIVASPYYSSNSFGNNTLALGTFSTSQFRVAMWSVTTVIMVHAIGN
jgi:hypothetical protein